jgi:hypothetical protein
MDRQIIVIANTLLTVLGSFAFGFFGIALAYPDAGYDAPTRMLVGLVLGTVVFFADLYFIIKGMEM